MTLQEASKELDIQALDPVNGHRLRVAALKYTHEILKQIQFLDGGQFHRTLSNLLGSIISTAEREIGVPLP